MDTALRYLQVARRSGIVLVAFLAAGLTVSCSGDGSPEERLYELPETLCGVDVAASAYDEIFPPGENVFTNGDVLEEGAAADCLIDVDGERAVVVSGFPKDRYYQDMVQRSPFDIDLEDGEPVAGRYDALVWPHVVMASSDCTWEGHTSGYTLAIYSYYPADDDESKRILSEMIQTYMHAAIEGAPCV